MINTPPNGFQIFQAELRKLKREIIDAAIDELLRRWHGKFTASGQISAGALGGTLSPSVLPPLAGDVTGAPGTNTVVKVQGIAVSTTDPTTGQVLKYDGAQWAPGTDVGVTDHGALTGLLDDDHTQYQKESEKGAANGYASLGSDSLVPQDQLGTGGQDGTKFLRDDGTWQALVFPMVGRYRAWTYTDFSAGEFTYVVDADGNPVYSLQELE